MKYCIVSKHDEYSQKLAIEIKSKIKLPYDDKKPDIVISVGGDGTILKALHSYSDICDDIVIFSINTGHLGFITNFTVEEIDKVAQMINNKDYIIEEVGLLDYEIETSDGITSGIALNEITVINPPRTLIVDVLIDGKELELFRGTGLCISSPFGSTAYNKSLHGCVVDPALKAFQLTEIASINSKAYRTLGSPLLLSAGKEITIINNDCLETWVTVDNLSYRLANFKTIKCRYSNHRIRFAQNNIYFMDRLKKAFINN
ncbi:MAG: NAD kinase [Anaeroplasmataceae bacterium]